LILRSFALAVVFTIAGCAPIQSVKTSEVKKTEAVDGKIVFIIPSTENEITTPENILAKNISFESGRYSARRNDQFLRWIVKESSFTVEGKGGTSGKESVKYDGVISQGQTRGNRELIFSLQNMSTTYLINSTSGNKLSSYSFPLSDVTNSASRAEYRWQLDFNSEFNSESVRANFVRLSRREAITKGDPDSVAGKIFKERFWIRVANEDVRVNIEVFPYRNGSKVIVYTQLKGVLTGQTVDFSKAASALKLEVERIVKS
jgi:hypothetical protein